jgi:outer membrane immunogenic protein
MVECPCSEILGRHVRKGLLATAALILGAHFAHAADLPPGPAVKAPPPAPAFNWTGFYIGAHVGYAFGAGDNDNLSGGFGGGQIGVNWQAPGSVFVLGVEADVAAIHRPSWA